MPLLHVLFSEGLKETQPVYIAGILKLPPISVPIPITDAPKTTKPDSPPLDPPGVLSTSRGFLAIPKILFSDSFNMFSYGTFDFTIIIPINSYSRNWHKIPSSVWG